MYTYHSYEWLAFFFIYCFLGWIFESAYVSIKTGQLVNRGFLRLPLLPLYGTGAVMMLWVSLPVRNHLFLVYLFGVFAATVLEYVTGYAMEQLFKMKYWDYSNQRFNFQGYICLSSSVAWGFLTILLTEVIHNPIEKLVMGANAHLEIGVVCVVVVFFAVDVIESTKAALRLGKVLETITKIKVELEEIQVQFSLMKMEVSQKVSEFCDEQSQRISDYKLESLLKATASQLKDKKVEELRDKLSSWIQMRNQISESMRSMKLYKLLLRNPTASSKQFTGALKDMKAHMKEWMNSQSFISK